MADHKDGLEDHQRCKRILRVLPGQFCGKREKVEPQEIRVD